ncbi:TPA: hypothetical protein ACKQDC_000146 [Serratia marcescens]
MTVQVEALTYEALKAKCDHLEQINAQTLQVKLTMAETIKELTGRANALAVENAALKESEVPLGAIENGRAFADRLEAYPFECQGGNLRMCSDWQELRRCFEHLSEWAMHGKSETPATDAALAAIRNEATARALKHLCDCQLISATVAELKATELREGK